jgi:hypothetical protein
MEFGVERRAMRVVVVIRGAAAAANLESTDERQDAFRVPSAAAFD